MQFMSKKKRSMPGVIIVSLIDVLMVVLIFMMVSTTFKNQPAVALTLPDGRSAEKAGSGDAQVVITVPKSGPIYYGTQPVTAERLGALLKEKAAGGRKIPVFIRADTEAHWGTVLKATEAARAAGFTDVKAFTKPGITAQ